MEDKASGWRNPKHRAQWAATLSQYAYSVFGDWQVDSDAVMRVLRPIWEKVPETASRLRGRIEAVLDAAAARGWRTGDNPARWKGHLAARLPPPPRKVKATEHQPALPWQQMPSFMITLRGREGMAARAVEFAILTAARSGEVRGLTWSEIDLDRTLWTVPARRMKAGRLHEVPLSAAAITLLQSVRMPEARAADLVFAGARAARSLSDMSLTAVLRRMNPEKADGRARWRDPMTGRPITVHGFRSTFRTWAGEETVYPREVVEAALAHTIRDKTEAAYARTALLERRRTLMSDWARFCTRGSEM